MNQPKHHHPVFTALLINREQPQAIHPDNLQAGGPRFEPVSAHHQLLYFHKSVFSVEAFGGQSVPKVSQKSVQSTRVPKVLTRKFPLCFFRVPDEQNRDSKTERGHAAIFAASGTGPGLRALWAPRKERDASRLIRDSKHAITC